jgi:UDP-N-acetylmuramate dehydrogenase
MTEIKPYPTMRNYSFYKTGGYAINLRKPDNISKFIELYQQEKNLNPWILGAGANTIFGDQDIHTPIFSTENLNTLIISKQQVTAEAGVTLNQLITTTITHGLAGLEKLSGIPGSVGGATWMNAGAYGTEISDFITTVTILQNGKLRTITKEQCDFSYRTAKKLRNAVVLQVTWQLPTNSSTELQKKRLEILKNRRLKQPLEFPSCGSVFKRPPGDYASRLIDAAGLKGYQIGGAQVSTKHAGFIINYNQATSADILKLIAHCQQVVNDKFQIKLELEQQVLLK